MAPVDLFGAFSVLAKASFSCLLRFFHAILTACFIRVGLWRPQLEDLEAWSEVYDVCLPLHQADEEAA